LHGSNPTNMGAQVFYYLLTHYCFFKRIVVVLGLLNVIAIDIAF